MKHRWTAMLLAAAMILPCAALFACTNDDPNVVSEEDYNLFNEEDMRLFGRTYTKTYSRSKALILDHAATGADFTFYGTELKVKLEPSPANLYIHTFVDDDKEGKFIHVNRTKEYTIAEGLEEGVHTVRLIKATSSWCGTITVNHVSTDGKFLRPEKKDRLRMEFVGDSITVGAGIYADPSTLNANENSDVAKCYAYLTAQELDADFSFVATEAICTKSKKFLTINAIEMYGQYSATHAGKYKIKEPYDIVVVGLGTNDASALAADPGYTPAALQADYTELLTLIRASNPEAKIVCVYGMMGETPTVKTSFTNAIAALGDANITYCTLPASTDGGQGHPSVKGAVTEAQTLLEHIRSLEA